jgi:hypothetical protein
VVLVAHQPYLHYVRHVVTWNVTSPYEYLSVSRPLIYSGTNQADPIFTVSMACTSPSPAPSLPPTNDDVLHADDHPTDRHGLGLNHGFLDDNVLISFGVADYGSGYIVRLLPPCFLPTRADSLSHGQDVLAHDLLTDHDLCAGIGGSSLWPGGARQH